MTHFSFRCTINSMLKENNERPKVFKSNVDLLFEKLKLEGRLTELSESEVAAIDKHLRDIMVPYRQELALKSAKSLEDLRKIVLNS